jgi:hypothetical protein
MTKKENKTKATKVSVSSFISSIKDEEKRKDAKTLLAMMKKITGKRAVVWGSSIVGFGRYEYKRRDGSEHDFFKVGFSPRKANLSVYIMPGFKNYKDLLKELGPNKTSVGCLYIKKLADVDLKVLEQIVKKGYKEMPDKMNY